MKCPITAAVVGLVAGITLWRVASHPRPESAVQMVQETLSPSAAIPQARNSSRAAAVSSIETTRETTPADFPKESVSTPARPSALAAAAEPPGGPEIAPGLTPMTAMENMRAVFRQYSLRFGGNPTGINREITTALNGGNSKQVVFLDSEDGIRVNARGELVDNWGTPYFFHQLSRTEMEIHSAGPDGKMWTEDDLIIK